eukprot:3736060-Rhodomonas_salina.2
MPFTINVVVKPWPEPECVPSYQYPGTRVPGYPGYPGPTTTSLSAVLAGTRDSTFEGCPRV